MEEKVIPTIDANRLLAAAKGAKAVSQYFAPTSNDAYGDVLKMSAALDEAKAPQTGRVLWVTPAFYNSIKKEITTTVDASGYNDKLIGRGFVGELDGTPVVKVPSSYFPTNTSAINSEIEPVVTYTVTGNESNSDLKIANRLSTVTGTVTKIGTSGYTANSDNKVTMTVNGKEVTLFVKSGRA